MRQSWTEYSKEILKIRQSRFFYEMFQRRFFSIFLRNCQGFHFGWLTKHWLLYSSFSEVSLKYLNFLTKLIQPLSGDKNLVLFIFPWKETVRKHEKSTIVFSNLFCKLYFCFFLPSKWKQSPNMIKILVQRS